ncbi:unnamed protein product [Lota lota]
MGVDLPDHTYGLSLAQGLMGRALTEELAFLVLEQQQDLHHRRDHHHLHPHHILANTHSRSALDFLRRLRGFAQDDSVRSIRWNHSGTCLSIEPRAFQREVRRRANGRKRFVSGSYKSFARSLRVLGFRSVRDVTATRSASLDAFLQEEVQDGGASRRCSQHRTFRRDDPPPQEQVTWKDVVRSKAPWEFSDSAVSQVPGAVVSADPVSHIISTLAGVYQLLPSHGLAPGAGGSASGSASTQAGPPTRDGETRDHGLRLMSGLMRTVASSMLPSPTSSSSPSTSSS